MNEREALNMVTEAWVKAKKLAVREGLHPIYLPKYDLLCRATEGTFWAPYFGLRTIEQQNDLYAIGRTKPGSIVTNAKGGSSAHNYGCATDWAEFKPEYEKEKAWKLADWPTFGAMVEEAGLEWGGRWHFTDNPHAQLKIKGSYREIGDIFLKFGKEKAMKSLEEKIK